MTLLALAKRHCLAAKPPVCVKPFAKDHYGVGYIYLRDVATGARRPSQKLLAAIRATHARLFPGEPLPTPETLGIKPPAANPSLN
jgi:hypothetical protein